MENKFKDSSFKNISSSGKSSSRIIKNGSFSVNGTSKIEILEESHEGVKIVLNKDENDSIKEIKFICSCGQTKSLFLDYSE